MALRDHEATTKTVTVENRQMVETEIFIAQDME